MSFLKRTMLYLTRKKGKTLILFLLVFTISTFVLSCFSILYATGEVATNMRTAVGAAFHIRSSVDVSMQDTSITGNTRAVISEQVIKQIMENKNLKYYNGKNSGYAKGLNFMPGAYHTDENNMGQVSANNYTALHPHFADKVLELVEGRHITPSDNNCILISEELAALNGLSVGDKVKLAPAELVRLDGNFTDGLNDSKTIVEAQIIGFFKELEPQGDMTYQPTAGLRSNMIFSDHSFFVQLGLANEGEYAGGVSFYIQDPLYLNAIVDEVQETNLIDWDSFFIRKDDFNYEKISAGLQTIQNLIKTLLVCVSIVSVAILILILTMRMRGRAHEAGILMSVGILKREILGQFISEVAFVALVGFVCSYFAAGVVSGRVESGIFDKLNVVQIKEQILQTGNAGSSVPPTLLTMPITITTLIFACLMVVIILSVILSSLAIIKLKPREIFVQNE